jgi:excinuclease UvrABC nuclease subunit
MNLPKLPNVETNELGMALYWRFTDTAIESVPEAPGVYAFFATGGKLTHLGSATKSLRAVFRSHWKGLEGRETCGAEYISWEASTDPMKLEAELVDRYAKKFGRIPRRSVG